MSRPAMTGATADRIEDLAEAADRLRELLAAHPGFPAHVDLGELVEIVQVARHLAGLGTAVACSSAAAWATKKLVDKGNLTKGKRGAK